MVKHHGSILNTQRSRFDLHTGRYDKVVIWLAVGFLVITGLLIRKAFLHAGNADYDIFSHWYDFAKAHGISSLKYGAEAGFSNYNPTYNYFLIVSALLSIPKALAIKGLMLVFDVLLAAAVYMVARQVDRDKKTAGFFALFVTFLPTVLITGALWGQFDQFYTAFIFFSLWAVLAKKSRLAWLFFGVAISIKLQAIFFLPVLVIMMFRRINWWDAWVGVAAFTGLTFLPMLFGRSFSSLVHIYTAQTTLFKGNLQMNAPNIYQWLPNTYFNLFNKAGVYWTIAVLAGLFIYAIYRHTFSRRDAVILTTLMLYLVPFLLPQMHERYFFPATVASVVAVLVAPRLWWVALGMQIVTLFSYMPFLFGQQPPVSFAILPLVGIAMIVALCYEYVVASKEADDSCKKPSLNKSTTHRARRSTQTAIR